MERFLDDHPTRRQINYASANPRANETRDRLVTALKELGGPSHRRLSASLISRQAGVARSSFYAHFADVADLVEFALHSDLITLQSEDQRLREVDALEDEEATRRCLRTLMHKLDEYFPLFDALPPLLGHRPSPSEMITREFEASVRATVRSRRPEISDDQVEIAASFLTGGVLTAYSRLADGPLRDEVRELLVDEVLGWMPEWIVRPVSDQ